MRRAAKTDANHAEIRQALRAAGWTVVDLSAVGRGVPDLLCAKQGRIELVEVKDGRKPSSARKLTPDETHFMTTLAAAGVTVRVVLSVEEALQL